MTERMDPEMRAAKQRMDREAAAFPPVDPTPPLDASRVVSDRLNAVWAEGGPVMQASQDRWVFARGRRVLCRMHRPTDAAVLPALVWFHGGGWCWSSIDTHDRLAREYAAAGGVAVINVDYALSPEAKFPQALLECADFVRALAGQSDAWGIDPTRISLGGDSADGNLALATALLLRDTGGPTLRGILTAYPVTDAACDTASYHAFGEGFGLTRAAMLTYWDHYLGHQADRLNPLASPLRADLAGLPPVLVQAAELDVLFDDGAMLAEKLAAAGVETTFETCPGVLHGFMRLSGAVGVARDAIARAGTWLRRVSA